VRLVAPPSFATLWLLPRLPRFYAANPDIAVQLSSTAAQDVLEQVSGATAATLRVLYGSSGCAPARCFADVLMVPDYVPGCAPALAEALREPADLLRQVLLHDDTFGEADGGNEWGWPRWFAAAGVALDSPLRGPHFSNAVLALEAALAGQGTALASRPLVSAHLASGALRQPLPLELRSPFSYMLVGTRAHVSRADVDCPRRWLVAEAAASR
jgi:LysR family glycine cleavage system transcriptional activator